MADDLNYGYKGADVPQSFGNNKGVFDPADINNLVKDDKWTQYGQLELIETQTVSSAVAQVDFTNLGNYNVHFVTLNNMQPATHNESVALQLSNNGGTSFITSGYQNAGQYGDASGSFGEVKNTSNSAYPPIYNVSNTATGSSGDSYMYFYNLLDSSKYSFFTNQGVNLTGAGTFRMTFSSGVLPTAETHNAIRYKFFNGNITDLQASLYGIKEYS